MSGRHRQRGLLLGPSRRSVSSGLTDPPPSIAAQYRNSFPLPSTAALFHEAKAAETAAQANRAGVEDPCPATPATEALLDRPPGKRRLDVPFDVPVPIIWPRPRPGSEPDEQDDLWWTE